MCEGRDSVLELPSPKSQFTAIGALPASFVAKLTVRGTAPPVVLAVAAVVTGAQTPIGKTRTSVPHELMTVSVAT